MKLVFVMIFTMPLCSCITHETILPAIHGVVIDAKTDRTIVGVDVDLNGNYLMTTDDNGLFHSTEKKKFGMILPASDRLVMTKLILEKRGYHPAIIRGYREKYDSPIRLTRK